MSDRSEEERERARAARAARRAGRADRVAAAPRPQMRERVDTALARSADRAPRTPVAAPTGNDGDGRPAPRRPRRAPGRILGIGALLLGVLALVAIWFLLSLFQPGKGDGDGRVAVRVAPGGGLGDIADRLDDAGVISKPFFFKLRARIDGHTSDLKPGNYVLRK